MQYLDMNKFMKFTGILIVFMAMLIVGSCEKFLNPDQDLLITEDRLYDDWYEYRSIEMGLYGLQQQLVEQLFILGELRGDLLDITDNAESDMVEIYNFNVSKNNKYASPTNFFKLISACNSFIRVLKTEHPEVLDLSTTEVNNYDRIYAEALCMRAWAYFNAVRIYRIVPYIPESLTTIQEVDDFIAAGDTYIDSVHIVFGKDGYVNDTTYSQAIELEKNFFDLDLVIDHFTNELENEIKAVGVNHSIDNNDDSWEVTIWNQFALDALLGHMYLAQGDLTKAEYNFNKVVYNSSQNDRYRLNNSFQNDQWKEIFKNIDTREHIYTIWFNKSNFQQNKLQSFFEPFGPHSYMLKPSSTAILKWESIWRWQRIGDVDNTNPLKTEMRFTGIPTDFYRGFGVSYDYIKNGIPLDDQEYYDMLFLRADGDDRNSRVIMDNVDTIVNKYSINKDTYDQDANYSIYRAAGIHLYLAEIYTYWAADHLDNGIVAPVTIFAQGILNDGNFFNNEGDREELGVLGRVGLGSNTRVNELFNRVAPRAVGRVFVQEYMAGDNDDGIWINNDLFFHDPYTNEIIGYKNLTNNLAAKQSYFEDGIIEERARELAFEGERFYDLMRIAKRRNDPSFLATRVASKFPSAKRAEIEAILMDEANWYIHMFD
jgi:hypothetical protein